MSVRGRVTLAVLVVAVPAVLVSVYLSWTARQADALEHAYVRTLELMANGGRARCEAGPDSFGRGPLVRRAWARFGSPGGLVPVRVVPYSVSFQSAQSDAPVIGSSTRTALDSTSPFAPFDLADGRHAVAMRMPWRDGECAIIVATISPVGAPSARRVLTRELIGALAVLALSLVVALVALGSPLGRLRALAAHARGLAASDFAPPEDVAGKDEIADVARGLAEASRQVRAQIARLEARDRTLTEYVDGTTHDIAVPLTVLQGTLSEVDSQLRAANNVDPALVASALAECQYLAQLASNLATAARLDADEPEIDRHVIDLGALVTRVAGRFAAVARHGGVALDHAVPREPVRVLADELLLERAVGNLVHNAIRHGAATRARTEGDDGTGHVALLLETVRAQGSAARFRIVVLDDGALVDEALLARLRNPPEAPSLAHRPRGRGLGLRVVRAVTEAHGFVLGFSRGEEGGLRATLEGELVADEH